MFKKNINFFVAAFFLAIFVFLPNSFTSATEYTAECPESAVIGSSCTLNNQTGKCKLKNVDGKPTKTCVVVEADVVGSTSTPSEENKDKTDSPVYGETPISANNSPSESETTKQKTTAQSSASNATTPGFDYTQEPSYRGLVPCGTDENSSPCTLCHLIIGIQRIFKYGLYLVTTLAFVGLFIGGAMYMLSSGDETMINSAKSFLKAALIGFALTIGAWLLVNIILNIIPLKEGMGVNKVKWYEFTCG